MDVDVSHCKITSTGTLSVARSAQQKVACSVCLAIFSPASVIACHYLACVPDPKMSSEQNYIAVAT